jgi:sec-independent protein translocase protein TatB
MFDIGFSELLVIAVVALIVLGPERLPKAARFAGLWVRRARQQWYSVKSEFENEVAAEELKRSLRETQESLRAAEAQLRDGATALQQQVIALEQEATEPASTPSSTDPASAQPEPDDTHVALESAHALDDLEPPLPADADETLVEASGETRRDGASDPAPAPRIPPADDAHADR